MDQPLTVAVRDAAALAAAEQYNEADSKYLFVQPQLGMFLNTVYVGQEMSEHVHDEYHQFVYVVEGRGRGHIAGEPVALRPGISIRVPAGVPHAWRNSGDGPLTYVELKVPAGPDANLQQYVEQSLPDVDRRLLGIDLNKG